MDGGKPELVLQAIASRFGAYFPKQKAVRCRVVVGLLVSCPNCSSTMAATSLHARCCPSCGTTLELNAEEVEAVTKQ